MKNIVKGAALLAGLVMLYRMKHGGCIFRGRQQGDGGGLWRKTPPNPDSYDKYGDMG